MKFLDQVKIFIKAGDGGSGSPSFRREKFIEFGGPDGGDGGKGGSIILKSERNLNTLIDFRYQQHFKSERGSDGKGKNQTGRGGKNLYRAQITKVGEKKKNQSRLGMISLGYYPTIEEASAAYESARKEEIQFLIETETDIRVKNALIKQQG